MIDLTSKFYQLIQTHTGKELVRKLLQDDMPITGKVSRYCICELDFEFDLREANVSIFNVWHIAPKFTKTYNYDDDIICDALFMPLSVENMNFVSYYVYREFFSALNFGIYWQIIDMTQRYNSSSLRFIDTFLDIKHHFVASKNIAIIIGDISINIYMMSSPQIVLYYTINYDRTSIYYRRLEIVDQNYMFNIFFKDVKLLDDKHASAYKKYKLLFTTLSCYIKYDTIVNNVLQEDICATFKYNILKNYYVVNTATCVMCKSLNVPKINYVMSPILILKTPISKNQHLVFNVNRATFMLVIYGLENKQEYIDYIKECFPNLLILIILDNIASNNTVQDLIIKKKFICTSKVLENECILKFHILFSHLINQEARLGDVLILKKILLNFYKSIRLAKLL